MLRTLTSTPPELLRAPPTLGLGPKPEYFTQTLDHFSNSTDRPWSQAFYVNDTFWVPGSDAPVFLCVGGEGPPLDGSVVVASPHCNNAVEWLPETKALMLAVEHRYYGCHNQSACPYTASDEQPLQWLSSRQALADLATFHAYAVKRWQLTSANKWVSFGGSYPGMLAGWFRVKYPELVHAAVASSAPVQAKVDMQAYNDLVADAYALTSVGGSAACKAAIASGHASIGALMNTSTGRAQLAKQFGLPMGGASLRTRAGQRGFAGEGVASFPAQSNDPTCASPGCNIATICAAIDGASGDGVAKLAALRALQRSSSSSTGGDGGGAAQQRKTLVEEEKEEATKEEEEEATAAAPASSVEAAWARRQRRRRLSSSVGEMHETLDYWGYQTCTEFGFYQTCEVASGCFFTRGLDLLADNIAFCASDYGIAPADVAAAVVRTNGFYGGARPDALSPPATRVLYPNGDVDPWHGLSVLEAPTPQLPVLMVAGASHHAWTHPSAPTDQPTVVAARQTIREQVTAWLAEEA